MENNDLVSPNHLDKKSIGELMALLRPAQLKAIFGFLAVILVGAFMFGFKTASLKSEGEVGSIKYESQNRDLEYKRMLDTIDLTFKNYEKRLSSFSLLEYKEQYLAFLSRYLLSEREFNKAKTKANRQAVEFNLKKLAKFVGDNVQKPVYVDRYISGDVPFRIGRNENIKESKLIFTYDNTSWPIPENAFSESEIEAFTMGPAARDPNYSPNKRQ